ncbi:MAG: hypothetical protein QE271_10920 [Bacteriovoracaceae bacterium]|nr:hypothetical protein [Bacteriovoracaceae bacterium]
MIAPPYLEILLQNKEMIIHSHDIYSVKKQELLVDGVYYELGADPLNASFEDIANASLKKCHLETKTLKH